MSQMRDMGHPGWVGPKRQSRRMGHRGIRKINRRSFASLRMTTIKQVLRFALDDMWFCPGWHVVLPGWHVVCLG
jgi:hypothetical protein